MEEYKGPGPAASLAGFLRLILTRRLRFLKDRKGSPLPGYEGFVIFREMTVKPAAAQPEKPAATCTVRFRFARGSARLNRRLSAIPALFIAAQPGFRSKLWAIESKTGEFVGVYEWDSAADAASYERSFPLRLLRKRAAAGTFSFLTETGAS